MRLNGVLGSILFDLEESSLIKNGIPPLSNSLFLGDPFAKFHSDFYDYRSLENRNIRGGMLPPKLSAEKDLIQIVGDDAARFILSINLTAQLLPGTRIVIDNPERLAEEFKLCDAKLRHNLEVFQLVPEQIKEIYNSRKFSEYPITPEEWRAMPSEVASQYAGWNGDNFYVDAVTINQDGEVSLTLMLAPNKLLDAESEARKVGLSDSKYSARQFHTSEIAIVVDKDGKPYLATQARAPWTFDAGDIEELSKNGEPVSKDKLRLVHPALTAGGVEPRKVIQEERLVLNPTMFGLFEQRAHEIGINVDDQTAYVLEPDPVALLHEGIYGITSSNKLPRSLWCNAMHVSSRKDGAPITVEEVVKLQEDYAKKIYPKIKAKDRGPEVRGCAFIPLSGGTFEVIDGLDKKGNIGKYLCVRNVQTVAISPDGEFKECEKEDVILGWDYTGILKHLLVEGDELRDLILAKANIKLT